MPPAKPKSKTSPKKKLKTARLEVRLTAEQKKRIERAAAKQGRTLSEYVVGRALEAEGVHLLVPDEKGARLIARALESAPEPNLKLRRATNRLVGKGARS